MIETLASIYDWITGVIVGDLQITAALLAMVISVATGKWRTAFAVGCVTWAVTPLFLAIMSHMEWLPAGQEKPFAYGFAAMLAVMGMHGIEQRVEQLDIKKLIGHVIDKIKGR